MLDENYIFKERETEKKRKILFILICLHVYVASKSSFSTYF